MFYVGYVHSNALLQHRNICINVHSKLFPTLKSYCNIIHIPFSPNIERVWFMASIIPSHATVTIINLRTLHLQKMKAQTRWQSLPSSSTPPHSRGQLLICFPSCRCAGSGHFREMNLFVSYIYASPCSILMKVLLNLRSHIFPYLLLIVWSFLTILLRPRIYFDVCVYHIYHLCVYVCMCIYIHIIIYICKQDT